ncbi:MAG: hypothetical protein GY938_16635 [Ketobacter sp.]|nr:hypothetical protein [Ketobacter sp.]
MTLTDDTENITALNSVSMELWQMYQRGNALEWRQLPLRVWNEVKLFDWVYQTWRLKRDEENWIEKMSPSQMTLIQWLTE